MTKYKQYFENMCVAHRDMFLAFKVVHDKYRLDKKTNQAEYNLMGEEIVKIIRDTEGSLCSTMERGKNNPYSVTLAERFWGEVRKLFPLIDFVGIKTD